MNAQDGLKICREDGRCQFAIDSGAEGMASCPKGKCCMPATADIEQPTSATIDRIARYSPNCIDGIAGMMSNPHGSYILHISHVAHCAQQVVEWQTAANAEARLADEWRERAIAAEAQLAARIEPAEPVAWAAFADNGNIRVWTAVSDDVRKLAASAGLELTPLYTAPQPAPSIPDEWNRITSPGQVKAGTKLRFTIGNTKYSETAKVILHPGATDEEIIYNKRRNFYLITSMAIKNAGSSKNVEFLAAAPKQNDGGDHE